MSYHEYPNGSRRHYNGHVARAIDFYDVIRQDQERKREKLEALGKELRTLFGSVGEFNSWIDEQPDNYQDLVFVMNAKIIELTTCGCVIPEQSCPACRQAAKRMVVDVDGSLPTSIEQDGSIGEIGK